MSDEQLTRNPETGGEPRPKREVQRHFVYIVRCADDTLYTGYTTDPSRRLEEHNRGSGSRYTRARRPVALAFLEERDSRAGALRREAEIKRLDKNGKLLLCRKYRSRERPS